ncbi:MAG: MFS transporter [Candidatus Thermoplasmatota archaeon]|nr:MFS transporter [Candidatus Thermoplasmatota archaeon]
MESPKGIRRPGKVLSALAISRDFSVLLTSLAVVSLGFGILTPIIPKFAGENLGMSPTEIGLVYSLFAVTYALFMLPAGYWADKVGRKQLMIAGILLFAATTFALAFITDMFQFAVLRALEGVGAALVTPAAFALTVDIVPENKRGIAMGAEGTAQLVGGLGGPGLGGLLAGEVGFYYPFYVAAALAVVCAVLIAMIRAPRVGITEEKPSVFSMFQSWKRNAQQNRALLAVTTRGFVMGIVQGLWSLGLILYWYKRLDMTETEVGLALSVGALVMLLGTLPFGALADRYGRRPFMILGGTIMVIGLGLNVVVTEAWHVVIIVAFSEFGAAMSNPSVGAMLADVMLKEERGRVMGAYMMIQGFGNIIGFSLLGWAFDAISPEAPIIMCTVALAVATAIIVVYVGETRKVAPSSTQAAAEAKLPGGGLETDER